MQKGSKVQAKNDHTVHPRIRGRCGVVDGVGSNGTVAVVFENDPSYTNVDVSCLDIVFPPESDPTPAVHLFIPE
jgi:hypothetical protein